MARGITQSDVDQAADALLLTGERPTVERIRQFLGTGSPNTVIRLLEVWWIALGPRLNAQQRKLDLPQAPEQVVALASQLWEQAMVSATELATRALATERQALEQERVGLSAAKECAEADTREARRITADAQAALAAATGRIADLSQLIELQAAQVTDLTSQRDRALRQGQALETELIASGARLDQITADAEASREAQTAHLRAVEDRAHGEVDRARQEARELRTQRRSLEKVHVHQIQQLQSELSQSRATSATLSRDLAVQQARGHACEQQLADLHRTLESTLADTAGARKADQARRSRPQHTKKDQSSS
jgi:chromosome segregation ATPase